jgi:hypothetical protein
VQFLSVQRGLCIEDHLHIAEIITQAADVFGTCIEPRFRAIIFLAMRMEKE